MRQFLMDFFSHVLWGLRGVYRLLRLLAAPVRREGLFFVAMLTVEVLCEWREGGLPDSLGDHLAALAVELYAVCLLLTAIPRRARPWARGLFYTIGYVVAAFEVFLYLRFGLIYSPTTLQIYAETTAEETREFFSAYLGGSAFWQTLLTYIPLVLINVLLAHYGGRWFAWVRLKGAGVVRDVVVVGALAWCAFAAWPLHAKMVTFFRQTSSQQVEKVEAETFFSPLWRLMYSARMLRLADRELDVLRENTRRVAVDSCTARCPNIVLIIGESYNRHHSQLYGYKRPTTPWQLAEEKAGRLVAFDDVVTTWNLTSNVFKNLFSTHSIDQPGSWCSGVLFPALFRRAGYRVAFLTNQYKPSRRAKSFDFNGSFFLNDAELDTLCFDYRNRRLYRYDRDFIREYEHFRPAAHNLVIFHLYGQHQKYSYRLQRGDVYFTADSIKRRNLKRWQRQIVADYDNATRCNDDVVRRICRYFADRDALVLYVADHGEEVFDRSFMFGRTPADPLLPIVACYEFEVPMEVWFSPLFRRRHPDVVRAVRDACHKPFMTDDLPHVLLGLAGIGCKQYDARRDLLNPEYNDHRRRMVKGLYDYDELLKGTKFERRSKAEARRKAARDAEGKGAGAVSNNKPEWALYKKGKR